MAGRAPFLQGIFRDRRGRVLQLKRQLAGMLSTEEMVASVEVGGEVVALDRRGVVDEHLPQVARTRVLAR